MNIDQRIEALTGQFESLHSSLKELRAGAEVTQVNIESLHSSAAELHAATQRHDALFEAVAKQSNRDGEHIRALVRIAEMHERRRSDLEGPENPAAS